MALRGTELPSGDALGCRLRGRGPQVALWREEVPPALHLRGHARDQNRCHTSELLLLLSLLCCIKAGLMLVLHQPVVVVMHGGRTHPLMHVLLLLMQLMG